jgi:hypothetical protein
VIHEAGEDEEFDYYIVHDSVGVSHILRKRKEEPPMVRCTAVHSGFRYCTS